MITVIESFLMSLMIIEIIVIIIIIIIIININPHLIIFNRNL